MAKIVESPADPSETVRYEETRTQEKTSSIKMRVIASYALLALLSAYTIYDYRIRPDCICRPRPYVFAISAFGVTGLYGMLGMFNRLNNDASPKGVNNIVYVLQMSLVLPLFAAEVWALEKAYRKHPDLVHVHVAAAVPGLANYFFQHEQKPWMMDVSLAYSFCTLIYLGIVHNVLWIILAAIMYALAYLYSERSQLMPKIDCFHDEEIINYCLSGFVFFSIFPDQRWMYGMMDGMEVVVFSVVLPYVAAEMWTMNKIFSKYKFLPSVVGSIGYPAVDYYYFFHKPLELYIEGALILQLLALFSLMAFMACVNYYVATALAMYAAYFTKLRFHKMPIPECWVTKTETINYALSTSILCASISMV